MQKRNVKNDYGSDSDDGEELKNSVAFTTLEPISPKTFVSGSASEMMIIWMGVLMMLSFLRIMKDLYVNWLKLCNTFGPAQDEPDILWIGVGEVRKNNQPRPTTLSRVLQSLKLVKETNKTDKNQENMKTYMCLRCVSTDTKVVSTDTACSTKHTF